MSKQPRLQDEYPFRSALSLQPLIRHLMEHPGVGICAPHLRRELEELLAEAPVFGETIQDPEVLKKHPHILQKLMSSVFSPVFWENEAVGAIVPFAGRPFHVSPLFAKLFLDEQGNFVVRHNVDAATFNRGRAIRAYLCMLKTFYGVDKELDFPVLGYVRDEETGLTRVYHLRLDLRFVEVIALEKLPKLDDRQMADVLDHLDDPSYLKRYFPPQHLEFRGFTIIHALDVTNTEMVSALSWDLIDQTSVISSEGFARLQRRLRTLFKRPDLHMSLAALRDDQVMMLNMSCEMKTACIFSDARHVPARRLEGTPYEKAIRDGEIIRVPDVLADPNLANLLCDGAYGGGLRSLIIAPLVYQGRTIGTLEVGSPRPGELGPMEAVTMSRIQPLFAMALHKVLQDMDNQIQAIIKEKCTAVHPAVEWRFRQAAVRLMEKLRRGEKAEIEPIVFRGVYPAYGSSDIRGSSEHRSRAVRADLAEHLRLGVELLERARQEKHLPIVEELLRRVVEMRRLLEEGAGGEELAINDFLEQEMMPAIFHLRGLSPRMDRAVAYYRQATDPKQGRIYRRRRQYEKSVARLNQVLTGYLDGEEAELQESFPHYFERHRTDGVDYIIYAGRSLMQKGRFDQFHLENLRLWQLMVACGLTWHSHHLRESLPLKLETSHLLLLQDSPLNIRFRYDEKRFDVDGTYDVRHEIIRSRLDKTRVRGSGERLTQPGRVAIVYSQEHEAQRILRHIAFLRSEGFFTDRLERLELEDMPGISGLKALRVEVKLDSAALARRAERFGL